MKKQSKGLEGIEVPNKSDLELKNVLYCIENKMTGDKYVGVSTRKFKDRLIQHLTLHSKQNSSAVNGRTSLYIDLNKYGPEIFKTYVIEQNDDYDYLIGEERRLRLDDEDYSRYSERDLYRDLSRKREYTKIVCTSINDNKVLVFKSQAECGRHFNCHRTNVTRALRGEYNLKRKWKVTYE
jgi:hypothetical protein